MFSPASRLKTWIVFAAAVLLAGCGPPPTERLRRMLDNTPPPVAAAPLSSPLAWQEGGFSPVSVDPQGLPYNSPPMPNAYGYLQNGPVFAGAEITGPQQTTATERALQLRQQIDHLTATRDQTRGQLTDLNIELAQKQQALAEAVDHLQRTQQELAAVRGELQSWNDDVRRLQATLRSSERKQLGALEDVAELLNHVIDQQQSGPATDANRPSHESPPVERSPPAADASASEAAAAGPTTRPVTNAVKWK